MAFYSNIQWWRPVDQVNEDDLQRGLKNLVNDAICSQVMGTLAGGAFLVAFALLLDANNLVIGLIAALSPLTQILQLPAIYIIERLRFRKLIVVISCMASRIFWFAIAAIPFAVPEHWKVEVFLLALILYYGLGTISGLAFNSWIRDLIPEHIRGSFSSRRMAIAIAVGATINLVSGFGVDLWKQHSENEILIYSLYYTAAGIFGFLGVWFLSRIPEPSMPPRLPDNIWTLLREPIHDANFRKLLRFLCSWNFAINLAAPFFTVYMLKRLGLDMVVIVALAVASQITNILFLRIWGRLADHLSNKSVLIDSGPLFILSILLWPFTTMPETHSFTLLLLILIHILSGISTAGVTLASTNIALKLSPKGRATAYLATSSMASGIAAFLAPVIGALAANWLDNQELTLSLHWLSSGETVWALTTINLRGLDFLFVLSFLFGLYALHQLLAIKEEGEVGKGEVLNQVRSEMRKVVGSISNVAGMRDLFYFPYDWLRGTRQRRKIRNNKL